jgi:hypothetical protein
MSEEHDMKEMYREMESLKLKLEEATNTIAEKDQELAEVDNLKKDVEVLRQKELERLIAEVIECELVLEKLDPKKQSDREKELKGWEFIKLEARRDVLKETVQDRKAKSPATGRAIIVNDQEEATPIVDPRLSGIPQDKLVKEAKIRKATEVIFGEHAPSKGAVRSLNDFDDDTGKWKTVFK